MDTRVEADNLRDLQSITDAALSYLPLESLLDELLTRVVEILKVDTAAILLLDDDEKALLPRSAKGLEEEVQRGLRIPVGKGFAGRVAADRRPVRLTNLEHAEIVNPLLLEKKLSSLLGVPLVVEGNVIGVLHVGSRQERHFTEDDIGLLQLAGDRAALAIHGRLAERDRGLADALQRSLIPKLPELPALAFDGRYLPAADAKVGGDWYDAFSLPGGRVGLAIGDVAGRGFNAAAIMGQLRSGLRAYALDEASPGDAVGRLSRLLRQLDPGRNATLLYAVLDPQEGSLEVAGAAHPPPLVVGRNGACSFVDLPGSVPLGAVANARYEDVEARLEPGSTLVLYTDGVIERPGERLDVGLDRLASVAGGAGTDPGRLCEAIISSLLAMGATRDDAALLTVASLELGETLRLRVAAEVESLPPLRRVLGRWLGEAGAGPAELEDISLACSEACANAIEHAYGPGPASIEVTSELSPDGEAVISVRDFGRWRPPRGEHRGRGMRLMEGLMDIVRVDPGDGGTTVTLRRRLDGAAG
jgi:serine phosphatase RsbU (regulator of sigma subunit)/anti-sigma regulatory factor (Ser/Thr protein kinase)